MRLTVLVLIPTLLFRLRLLHLLLLLILLLILLLLSQVTGLDSVDDESKNELSKFDNNSPQPADWDMADNPPYSYYIFYMYANLTTLNNFRRLGLGLCGCRCRCVGVYVYVYILHHIYIPLNLLINFREGKCLL